MLSFDTALKRVLSLARTSTSENIPLASAVGRYLAADITADRDLPGFDYSAMDGYAVRVEDLHSGLPCSLPVKGESRAGQPEAELSPRSACRIFTGGAVPRGATAVEMQENVMRNGNTATFSVAPKFGNHIRKRGEDLAAGALALASGTRLNPFHLGLLASLEVSGLQVWRKPKAVILCTGDELRRPGDPVRPGSIPESNGVAIQALLNQAGADATLGPLVPDDLAVAEQHLKTALGAADLVLTIGGVSVGDHDVMRDAMQNQGVDLDFWKVAIKPGKPLVVGHHNEKLVLGLPGNPASAQVTCILFALPLLRAMQGARAPEPHFITGTLKTPIRQKAGRRGFYRIKLNGEQASLPDNQSSGSAPSLAWADGLAMVPEDCTGLDAGSPVQILRLTGYE